MVVDIQGYDNYDKAVVDWIHSLRTRGDKLILCVFATPQRAFGQVRKHLQRVTGDDQTPKKIPLPFASIQPLPIRIDMERFNCNRIHSRVASDWEEGDPVYEMRYPLPYMFPYQVELWARNRSDLLALGNQLRLRLQSNYCYLIVEHNDPVGDLMVFTLMVDHMDNSNLIPGGDERILRHTYTFEMQGWMYDDPSVYPRIEEIEIEFVNYEDPTEVYDEVTITAES